MLVYYPLPWQTFYGACPPAVWLSSWERGFIALLCALSPSEEIAINLIGSQGNKSRENARKCTSLRPQLGEEEEQLHSSFPQTRGF